MRMSVRFPVFAALLALLSLLAACSLPPYNEDLSLAQITKSKMQRVNGIGPVHAWLDDDAPETEYYFLPDRNDPVNGGGFFVNAASYGMQVRYFRDDSSTFEGWWATNLDNDVETANNYLLQPIESGLGTHYLSLTRYLQNDLLLISASDPTIVQQAAGFPKTFSSLFTASVSGSNIYPDSTAGSDLHYFLCYSGPSVYNEVVCNTNTTSGAVISNAGPVTDLGLVPDGLTNAFYHHDPTADKSYLSYWSASASDYRSYTWSTNSFLTAPTGFQQLSGIKGRIDAVLSSGELLSFQDGACTVYNGDGSKLYRFPLGGLRFCYERWDPDPIDPKFKLYFSLSYWLYGSDEVDDRLFVEVYAIPTADLKDLD